MFFYVIGGKRMNNIFEVIGPYLTLIFLLILFIVFGLILKRSDIKKSGNIGERKAREALSELNSEYTVLSNLRLTYNHESNETDDIIVGPTGIFVIEVKNHNGYIVGNEQDYEFTQYKVGRKGGRYSKKIYSPVKQVNKQVFILSQILKSNGMNHWINSIVLFTNPKVKLNIKSTRVKVMKLKFGNKNNLINYIEEQVPKRKLREKECESIVEIINEYSKSK